VARDASVRSSAAPTRVSNDGRSFEFERATLLLLVNFLVSVNEITVNGERVDVCSRTRVRCQFRAFPFDGVTHRRTARRRRLLLV
jgi:hypothetical protein